MTTTHTIELSARGRFFVATCEAIFPPSLFKIEYTSAAAMAARLRTTTAVLLQRGELLKVPASGSDDTYEVIRLLNVLPDAPGVPVAWCSTTGLFFHATQMFDGGLIDDIQTFWTPCAYCNRARKMMDVWSAQAAQPHMLRKATQEPIVRPHGEHYYGSFAQAAREA